MHLSSTSHSHAGYPVSRVSALSLRVAGHHRDGSSSGISASDARLSASMPRQLEKRGSQCGALLVSMPVSHQRK